MKRILVTGGGGFIGSNFTKYVLEKKDGAEISCLDKITYAGQGKNLEHMGLEEGADYHFFLGDIADKELVEHILQSQNIEAVVNFAAESHVDRSIEDTSPFVDSNIKGTQILLDATRKNNVGKFIQIGTDEVYGSLSMNSPSSKEEDILKPRSPYSASKASADLLALSYFETHGLPVCVTRSSNNYGPYQFPEKFMPLSITNLIRGKSIPIYGSGKNIRDWIFVEDNCSAIYRVLMEGKAGEIYNIGGGNEIQNIALAKIILSDFRLGGEEGIEFVDDRKGHDFRYSVDSSKIRDELKWAPQVTFAYGLKRTIKWYKDNEDWWGKLKDGKK